MRSWRKRKAVVTKRSNDSMDGITASVRLSVPFFDLDSAGVVWHGRYFKYFELARAQLLDEIGYSYGEMATSGFVWLVTDTDVRYVRPLVLNQEIVVTAGLREWEMRLVVDYRIEDLAGNVCTRATTTQVPVDAETRSLAFGSPGVFIERVEAKLRERGLSAP